jgi:hypothetical protein
VSYIKNQRRKWISLALRIKIIGSRRVLNSNIKAPAIREVYIGIEQHICSTNSLLFFIYTFQILDSDWRHVLLIRVDPWLHLNFHEFSQVIAVVWKSHMNQTTMINNRYIYGAVRKWFLLISVGFSFLPLPVNFRCSHYTQMIIFFIHEFYYLLIC